MLSSCFVNENLGKLNISFLVENTLVMLKRCCIFCESCLCWKVHLVPAFQFHDGNHK